MQVCNINPVSNLFLLADISGGHTRAAAKRCLSEIKVNYLSASSYSPYCDVLGCVAVAVRVMRQSKYPMDKTRVALIRARQRINWDESK